MTVVVGTAGHIDHGKTALLRALTGIDADRLPEERRRGMTIDVGYAWMALPDGREVDFVDVPGHDRLVGNMLVGAGEVDAALVVVAADEGPAAQTVEHVELLDALGIEEGIVAVTKIDLLEPDDPRREAVPAAVRALLAATSLRASPVHLVSAVRGDGIARLTGALAELVGRLEARGAPTLPDPTVARLPIDRAFVVRGRGTVVTGTLRGGPLRRGMAVRVEPGGRVGRIRELQVHGRTREESPAGGRVALNLAGIDVEAVERGMVVVPAGEERLTVSDRLLVSLRPPAPGGDRLPEPGDELRLHLLTAQAAARLTRWLVGPDPAAPGGTGLAILQLDRPVAVLPGDRFALRRPSPPTTAAGGRILDPHPPRGPSRRRLGSAALAPLAAATTPAALHRARLGIHGVLATADRVELADDLQEGLRRQALDAVAAHHAADPLSSGIPAAALRQDLVSWLRRRATVDGPLAARAADAVLDRLLAEGLLARHGDRVRDPRRGPELPAALLRAMAELEGLLDVPAPPPLAEAARRAGCPPEGVRELERSGRIVRVGADLAYAAATWRRLEGLAVAMARQGPLTPAAFRDATGTSRRFVLAILEELNRRGVLVRAPDGHRPGPRTAAGTALRDLR